MSLVQHLPPEGMSLMELEDLQLAGFTLPGWYFLIEEHTHSHGPYTSESMAEYHREQYVNLCAAIVRDNHGGDKNFEYTGYEDDPYD